MIEADDGNVDLLSFLGRHAEETTTATAATTTSAAEAATAASADALLLSATTATARAATTTAAAAAATAAASTPTAAKLGSDGYARKRFRQPQVERLLSIVRNNQPGLVIIQGDELCIDLAGCDSLEEFLKNSD